jgi:hypothetical protein
VPLIAMVALLIATPLAITGLVRALFLFALKV